MRMLTKSRLVIVAVAVAMGFCLPNVANAADPVKRGDLGTGLVFNVGKEGDAKFKTFLPVLGSPLETGIYAPKDDSTKKLGLPKGVQYTMLKIDNKDGSQTLIQWSTNEPDLQDILGKKTSKISGVSKDLKLQVGDTAKIQAQRDGKTVLFTFEFFRDKKEIGTLSFNVDSKK